MEMIPPKAFRLVRGFRGGIVYEIGNATNNCGNVNPLRLHFKTAEDNMK